MTKTTRSLTPFADYVAEREREASDAKVFPCVPNGKKPLTPRGHLDASADIAQLRQWAADYPDANVGLDPHSVGLSVVDIDGLEGEAEWAVLQIENDEIITAVVYTPRGGRHLYFAGALPTTTGKLAPHIDTRGSGTGYVLIPPSRTADGVYFYD